MGGLEEQGDALRSLLGSGAAHSSARELSGEQQPGRAIGIDRKRDRLTADKAGASGVDSYVAQVR